MMFSQFDGRRKPINASTRTKTHQKQNNRRNKTEKKKWKLLFNHIHNKLRLDDWCCEIRMSLNEPPSTICLRKNFSLVFDCDDEGCGTAQKHYQITHEYQFTLELMVCRLYEHNIQSECKVDVPAKRKFTRTSETGTAHCAKSATAAAIDDDETEVVYCVSLEMNLFRNHLLSTINDVFDASHLMLNIQLLARSLSNLPSQMSFIRFVCAPTKI